MEHKLLRTLAKVAQGLLGLLILYAISRNIYTQWTTVRSVTFQMHPVFFLAGLTALFSFYLLYTFTWQRLLNWMEGHPSEVEGITLHRIFFNSLLTRYLPAGKIWNISSRIELYKRAGGQRSIAAQSLLLDQTYLMGGALFLAWIALLPTRALVLPGVTGSIRTLLIVVGGIGFVLIFAFTDRVLALLLRVTGLTNRFHLPRLELSVLQRGEILSRYLLINLLQGLAAYLFLRSVYSLSIPRIEIHLVALIAYPLSRLIGQLSTIMPGGLGVREGTFAYLLGSYVPVQVALLGAGLTRLVSVLIELAINLSVTGWARRKKSSGLDPGAGEEVVEPGGGSLADDRA